MICATKPALTTTMHDSILLEYKIQHRFFITTATPKTRHGCPDYFVLYGIGEKTCPSFDGIFIRHGTFQQFC
jgi:hypothetical protein